MKSLGSTLFAATGGADDLHPKRAFERVSARDLGLVESWFRDAIHADPELVIGPCREAGKVQSDEAWLPWAVEFNAGNGPMDVLLVSSRGRVAIVETKLSYNPERRREVVAQVLDYALALQETALDDLPSLPRSELCPDLSDLEECLAAGRFLLIIAGDALDPRALRLSEGLLGRHLTAEWDLAMVDLNLYRPLGDLPGLLLVPELRGMVVAEVRQVVRIKVEGETPKARIVVERVAPTESTTARPGKLTVESLKARLRAEAPDIAVASERVLDLFQQIARDSDGLWQCDLQAFTANLYLNTPKGRKRVLVINAEGRFRVTVHYLAGKGFHDQVELIRKAALPLVVIGDEDNSAALWMSDANAEPVCKMVERITSSLAAAPIQE